MMAARFSRTDVSPKRLSADVNNPRVVPTELLAGFARSMAADAIGNPVEALRLADHGFTLLDRYYLESFVTVLLEECAAIRRSHWPHGVSR
jgi:hypothetical protein